MSDLVCWEFSAKSFVDSEFMRSKNYLPPPHSADQRGIIDQVEIDANGDLLPDRFELVEMENAFLLRWQPGVVFTESWENCGGGEYSYYGHEPNPVQIALIQKDPKQNTQATNLLWRIDFSKGKSRRDGSRGKPQMSLAVYGSEVSKGKEEGWEQHFIAVACPDPKEKTETTQFPRGDFFSGAQAK